MYKWGIEGKVGGIKLNSELFRAYFSQSVVFHSLHILVVSRFHSIVGSGAWQPVEKFRQ